VKVWSRQGEGSPRAGQPGRPPIARPAVETGSHVAKLPEVLLSNSRPRMVSLSQAGAAMTTERRPPCSPARDLVGIVDAAELCRRRGAGSVTTSAARRPPSSCNAGDASDRPSRPFAEHPDFEEPGRTSWQTPARARSMELSTNLVGPVMQARAVHRVADIHAGPLAHGVEALEHRRDSARSRGRGAVAGASAMGRPLMRARGRRFRHC